MKYELNIQSILFTLEDFGYSSYLTDYPDITFDEYFKLVNNRDNWWVSYEPDNLFDIYKSTNDYREIYS